MNAGPLSLSGWVALSAAFHAVLFGIRLADPPQTRPILPIEFVMVSPPADLPSQTPAPASSLPAAPLAAEKAAMAEAAAPLPAPPAARPEKAPAASTPRPPKPAAARPASRALSTRQAFPFTYYARILQDKIWREWGWSSSAGRRQARVEFRIERDGDVSRARLARSSGDALYDQASLRAVQAASPFPPLPEAYRQETLDVFFDFNLYD